MSWWQFIYFFLAFASAGMSGWLAYFGWRRRRSESGLAFMLFACALMIWSFFYAFEIASNSPATKLTLSKLMYFGIVAVAPSWFIFALYYTGNSHWITRRRLVGIWVIPLLILCLVLTNDWHHLHWRELLYSTDEQLGFLRGDVQYGASFWLHTLYAYVLMLMATALLARVALNAVRHQQRQASLILISVFIPWASNIIYVTRTNPLGGLDITPMAFTVAGALIGWVLVRFRALENIPIARETIIEGLADGILLLDCDHFILDINRAACELCQLEDVLGESIEQALYQYPKLLQLYHQLLKSKQSSDEITLRDGVILNVAVSTIYNYIGDPAGYLLILHDITQRKQAEEKIARHVAELRTLREIDARISESLDITAVLDTALTSAVQMTRATAGFITLIEEEGQRLVQAHGHYKTLPLGELFPKHFGIVGRVIRTGKAEFVQDVTADADYYVDVQDTCSEMVVPLIAHEKIIGILNLETSRPSGFKIEQFEFVKLLAGRIATAIENAQLYTTLQAKLEELQKLYHQVKNLEQMKTDMIRIASHDLRNPLANIRGYLDLLQIDRDLMTEDHVMYVNMMVAQAIRMEQIIKDILSLERYQAEAVFEPIDMRLLVLATVADYEDQADQKSLTITLDVPSTPIEIEGDQAQLREAISNLIVNAIKYTPAEGQIHISLQTQADRLIFKVKDTGYGIPEDKQAKLFSPFFRAKSEETAEIEGTGLGLHLVKNIIQRHHGQVFFESVYTQGSTFGFEIPLNR